MEVLYFIGIILGIELFSFITMKFYWPNKIFGIIYQLARILLCIVIFSSLDDKDMVVMYAILFGFLEFLIISNLIGQAGCQDDRSYVDDVSSFDFAGDMIIQITRHRTGDSAWGNMVSSITWSAILGGITGLGCYFLFTYKPLIGGIAFLVLSVLRLIGIIHGIVVRNR